MRLEAHRCSSGYHQADDRAAGLPCAEVDPDQVHACINNIGSNSVLTINGQDEVYRRVKGTSGLVERVRSVYWLNVPRPLALHPHPSDHEV